MKYGAKSVVFGRKPRQTPESFKTAFFRLYDDPQPLVSGTFPKQELDFPNVEKVVIKNPNAQYYLEGNDIVFDNISVVTIDQDGTILTVTVE